MDGIFKLIEKLSTPEMFPYAGWLLFVAQSFWYSHRYQKAMDKTSEVIAQAASKNDLVIEMLRMRQG